MSPTAEADPGADALPVTLEYAPRAPVAVRATLAPLRRGPGDPCLRHDGPGPGPDAGVWLALRTRETGTATLHLEPHGSGVARAVRVRAWGTGAAEALDGVPALLGARDDWGDLDVAAHPLLADSRHRNPGLRLTRTERVVDVLAAAVIEQKITGVEAFRAWRVLVTRHGEPAPGPAPPGLRVPPTAEAWRRIPSWEWHRAGVDPRRSATVVRAAAVASGLERTAAASSPHAAGGPGLWRALRTVSGVGEWTAAEAAQRSHGDPDAVSFGDYHLASVVGQALVGAPLDDAGLAELLEPWAGQRQRVVRLVLASGFRAPRHGPRMTIQDHRGH